jgi:4-hydroxybutyryl-CoA dehydratase/vinylacetyl-CoA-Delta-isomerase
MAIRTAQQYRESLKKLAPRAYLGGKRIKSILQSPTAISIMEGTARSYEMSNDPLYKDTLTTKSHLTSKRISRATRINRSVGDLEKRVEMAVLMGQELGTCYYRCGASNALTHLASVTWEMDRKLGTDYSKRFDEYLRFVQDSDLVLSIGVNDPKGIRTKGVSEQDPDMALRVVERKDGGIVVRGAKLHQTGAVASHEHLILPGSSYSKGEEDYAIAFAVPNGAKGITYICQYNPYTAERECEDDLSQIGNPRYGQRETAMVIFDDVFIPEDRIFLCGEAEFTARLRDASARLHSTCEAACKAGWLDLMIGAARLSAEYSGLEDVPHIQMDLASMIKVREICYALAVAAVARAKEEPLGSGVFLPDITFARMALVYCSYGFWEAIEKATDVAGGLVITMPSEQELTNPETSEYVKKYLKSAAPAEKRLRISKFLQNWVCGLHGAATWVGGGVPYGALMAAYNSADWAQKKGLAARLAGLE